MVRLEEVPDEEILRQQRASDAAAVHRIDAVGHGTLCVNLLLPPTNASYATPFL